MSMGKKHTRPNQSYIYVEKRGLLLLSATDRLSQIHCASSTKHTMHFAMLAHLSPHFVGHTPLVSLNKLVPT